MSTENDDSQLDGLLLDDDFEPHVLSKSLKEEGK